MDSPNDISRMRTYESEDGVVIFKDPMTRKTKKNRHRHMKDGAPKNMRGVSHESYNHST